MFEKEKFDEVFDIMEEAFPKNEYRIYEEQKKLLDNDKYFIDVEVDENKKILGFMASWEFENFIFIEHIAVSKESRGKGIGSKMLKKYVNSTNLPLILEVEPDTDDLCKRRIKFYERLGFCLNMYSYSQPPLRVNESELPLYIMSYPRELNLDEFEIVKEKIHNNVYLKNKTARIY